MFVHETRLYPNGLDFRSEVGHNPRINLPIRTRVCQMALPSFRLCDIVPLELCLFSLAAKFCGQGQLEWYIIKKYGVLSTYCHVQA